MVASQAAYCLYTLLLAWLEFIRQARSNIESNIPHPLIKDGFLDYYDQLRRVLQLYAAAALHHIDYKYTSLTAMQPNPEDLPIHLLPNRVEGGILEKFKEKCLLIPQISVGKGDNDSFTLSGFLTKYVEGRRVSATECVKAQSKHIGCNVSSIHNNQTLRHSFPIPKIHVQRVAFMNECNNTRTVDDVQSYLINNKTSTTLKSSITTEDLQYKQTELLGCS